MTATAAKLAFRVWKRIREDFSSVLLKKGYDRTAQTIHGAWLSACEAWLAYVEANEPEVFYRLVGEDDTLDVIEDRLLLLVQVQEDFLSAFSRDQWNGLELPVANAYTSHGVGGSDDAREFAKALVRWMAFHLQSHVTDRPDASHELSINLLLEMFREIRRQRSGAVKHKVVSHLPTLESAFAGRDAELADRPKLAIDYNNMSQIEKARGNLDRAEVWLDEAAKSTPDHVLATEVLSGGASSSRSGLAGQPRPVSGLHQEFLRSATQGFFCPRSIALHHESARWR